MEVSENATDKEIKRARNRLVSKFHPDKHPNVVEGSAKYNELLEKTKEINWAYEEIQKQRVGEKRRGSEQQKQADEQHWRDERERKAREREKARAEREKREREAEKRRRAERERQESAAKAERERKEREWQRDWTGRERKEWEEARRKWEFERQKWEKERREWEDEQSQRGTRWTSRWEKWNAMWEKERKVWEDEAQRWKTEQRWYDEKERQEHEEATARAKAEQEVKEREEKRRSEERERREREEAEQRRQEEQKSREREKAERERRAQEQAERERKEGETVAKAEQERKARERAEAEQRERVFQAEQQERELLWAVEKIRAGAPARDFVVMFGKYKWRILDVKDDRVLIITDEIIERQACHETKIPHEKNVEITWKDCTLRTYLNQEFYNSFTDAEKVKIINLYNKTPTNPWFTPKRRKNIIEYTADCIFLLNLEEIVKYFGDSGQLDYRPKMSSAEKSIWDYWYKTAKREHRKEFKALGFPKKAFFIMDDFNLRRVAKHNQKAHWWWLRSSGGDNQSVANVYGDSIIGGEGLISMSGERATFGEGGVRPALWLHLGERYSQNMEKPSSQISEEIVRNATREYMEATGRVIDNFTQQDKDIVFERVQMDLMSYANAYNSRYEKI
ncbi:MAG: DUF6273 domain-containing protein [Treponema sp.]|nr:DUF6273 domain-containing protein [Treponema sp.]